MSGLGRVNARGLVTAIAAVVWLLLVNVVFFWGRIGDSGAVRRIVERLGGG